MLLFGPLLRSLSGLLLMAKQGTSVGRELHGERGAPRRGGKPVGIGRG